MLFDLFLYLTIAETLILGKGDPPTSSATAKDIKKDQEIDRKLIDPPILPPHLSEHDRRASRVDVNVRSIFFALHVS